MSEKIVVDLSVDRAYAGTLARCLETVVGVAEKQDAKTRAAVKRGKLRASEAAMQLSSNAAIISALRRAALLLRESVAVADAIGHAPEKTS